MTGVFEPPGQQSFFLTKIDVNGNPYTVPNAGGFVYMYEPGSTVPKTTWVDSAQTTANTDPIRLDPDGRCIIYGTGQYRQIVTDAQANVQWDQLTELGIDGTFITGFIIDTPVTVDGPNPNPPLNTPDQGTRPLAAVLGSFVDARNGRFGALRQGGDDLIVIQNAINYAADIGGATVYLGPGPLSTASGSQVVWPSSASGVSLRGDGPYATVLTIPQHTGDVMVVTAGSLAGCQIRDMGFICNGTPVGGALIRFGNTYDAHVENVRMSDGFANGVVIVGGGLQSLVTIRDMQSAGGASTNAHVLIGDDVAGIVTGVYIDTCKFLGGNFGVYLRNANRVSIIDTECQGHEQAGVITSPGPGEIVKELVLSNVLIDGGGVAAVDLGHSGGTVVAVSIAGGTFNSALNGIDIAPNPNVNNVSIVGAQLFNNERSAVINRGANSVEISGCAMAGNGTATANTYDTVAIQGGCILNGVDGNVIGAATSFPAVHRHAISLFDTVDFCTVTGNKTGGPAGTSPPINNVSTGTHNVVANNVGT